MENFCPFNRIEKLGRKHRGEFSVRESWRVVLFHELDILGFVQTFYVERKNWEKLKYL